MHGVMNHHRDLVEVIVVVCVGDGNNYDIFQSMYGPHFLEHGSRPKINEFTIKFIFRAHGPCT